MQKTLLCQATSRQCDCNGFPKWRCQIRILHEVPRRQRRNFAITVSFAGSGVKRGVIHEATDGFGFRAVEHEHYVTDIHAMVLHLLGLDPRRLDIAGRKRLEIDHGQPIREILA